MSRRFSRSISRNSASSDLLSWVLTFLSELFDEGDALAVFFEAFFEAFEADDAREVFFLAALPEDVLADDLRERLGAFLAFLAVDFLAAPAVFFALEAEEVFFRLAFLLFFLLELAFFATSDVLREW
jgi:hypothetical protein